MTLEGDYGRDGWCRFAFTIDRSRIGRLRARADRIAARGGPEVVHEEGSTAVRAIHGCHRVDDACDDIVRHPDVVDAARAVVGRDVYVYQFKINFKAAREGASWPWHQDYAFWHREDGMRRPDAVTVAVLLDEVTEDNGPLRLVSGTHRSGLVDERTGGGTPGDWTGDVSSDLTYTVPDVEVGARNDRGIASMTGPEGSVFAFHPCLVHSSTANRSASPRKLLLITYNAVDNAPEALTRPEFLVERDTSPVRAGRR